LIIWLKTTVRVLISLIVMLLRCAVSWWLRL
jgi:hypothetical protein